MARKFYNEETFTCTVADGTEYTYHCKTQNTSYGFRHVAFDSNFDQVAKATYYNRTWECFRYETLLKNCIEKAPKEHRQELTDVLILKKEQQEHEECEQFVKNFETLYNGLSKTNKEILKTHTPLIQTQEQADTVVAMMKFMHAIDVACGKEVK